MRLSIISLLLLIVAFLSLCRSKKYLPPVFTARLLSRAYTLSYVLLRGSVDALCSVGQEFFGEDTHRSAFSYTVRTKQGLSDM
ncbi:hypothetical protein Y032_0017g3452 [Ancylostoma ceylanicum]|uniref:Secreted protein n=1 Tax=Ancylostoma ceylanicum TaxID=53326 RepID=A0A016V4M8_9BILA|nr:hypothetical protein Y032_0017g3452 [Ancylostoma ceylanicum]